MKRLFILTIAILLSACSGEKDSLSRRYPKSYLQELLEVARLIINDQLQNGIAESTWYPQYGDAEQGIFIRLTHEGRERGCIGFYHGIDNLEAAAAIAALNAAFFDPRFPPLTEEELEGLEVEVTIVGPFREMKSPYDFKPGKESLLLDDYSNRAFLQASVAADVNLDKEEFLEILCRKAGLDSSYLKKSYCRILKAETVSLREMLVKK